MKQHIDKSQLNELSEKGEEKLSDWYEENNAAGQIVFRKDLSDFFVTDYRDGMQFFPKGCIPLLSIGQMIEFLDSQELTVGPLRDYADGSTEVEELCDELWQAVKEVLEEK